MENKLCGMEGKQVLKRIRTAVLDPQEVKGGFKAAVFTHLEQQTEGLADAAAASR